MSAAGRGERPGIFYHVDGVIVYLGRQRGGWVAHRKSELEALSCRFCPKRWSFERMRCENIPLLIQNEEHVREMRSFEQGPLPPSVYLGVH